MTSTAAASLLLTLACACGAGNPGAAVRDRAAVVGVAQVRDELLLATATDPGDVDAHRRLAALELQLGNRGGAIEQLQWVVRLSGPLGPRFADGQARDLGELLLARAQLRATLGDPAGLSDLEAAASLGIAIDPATRRAVVLVAAAADLRHAAGQVRARAKAQLRSLAANDPVAAADPRIVGASSTASAEARAAFAQWAWSVGARRAAVDEVIALGAAAPIALWRDAMEWWRVEGSPKPEVVPAGAAKFDPCAAGELSACSVLAAAQFGVDGPPWEASLWRQPPSQTSDPIEAAAWVVSSLRAVLLGRAPGWLATLRQRVVVDSALIAAAPVFARPTLLRLSDRVTNLPAALDAAVASVDAQTPSSTRLVIAAELSLAGRATSDIERMLDGISGLSATALRARIIAAPVTLPAPLPSKTALAATSAATWVGRPDLAESLQTVADVFDADRILVERAVGALLARDLDNSSASAALGTLFDLLGDPVRARENWQRAVDASPNARWQLGLAMAAARSGDPDAALIFATAAAASSGDPSPALTAVAHALLDGDAEIHALEVAREAISLAGPSAIADAVSVAVLASERAGRPAQGAALTAEWRSVLAPPPVDDDATDVRAAFVRGDRASLDVAARWHPRSLAGVAARAALIDGADQGDPRAAAARAELVGWATDVDCLVALAAIRALLRDGRP